METLMWNIETGEHLWGNWNWKQFWRRSVLGNKRSRGTWGLGNIFGEYRDGHHLWGNIETGK